MISIREMDISDIRKVTDLRYIIYRHYPGEERMLWKYFQNPHGETIVFVAETADLQIIGLRAFWPRKLVVEGQHVVLYQAVDVAVHPDYRRQGIFTEMTNVAIEAAQKQGAAGFFNFPHKTSMPGYLKIGWKRVKRLHWWVRPLPSVRSFASKDVAYAELNLQPCGGNEDRRTFLRLQRDPEYLHWRYGRRPDKEYKFWNLGVFNGQTLYAITQDVYRKKLPGRVLIDIIGGEFSNDDVPGIMSSLIAQTAEFSHPLMILEGTLGFQTKIFAPYGFLPVPRLGVNYVATNCSTAMPPVPFNEIAICPGDMDTF